MIPKYAYVMVIYPVLEEQTRATVATAHLGIKPTSSMPILDRISSLCYKELYLTYTKSITTQF